MSLHPEFNLAARMGLALGWSSVIISGHNPANLQASTILGMGNAAGVINPSALLGTPATVSISSTNQSNDDATGTGANSVTIVGLDANGDALVETLTMHATDGRIEVDSTGVFSAINRIFVATAGSGAANVGTIWCGTGTVTSGVPAVGIQSIQPLANLSHTGHYTVARNHKLVIMGVTLSCAGSTNAFKGVDFTGSVFSAAQANTERTVFSLHSAQGGSQWLPVTAAFQPAHAQLRLRASTEAAQAASCSMRIDAFLQDLGVTRRSDS